ncbi:MAG: NPCBM/NEW2 domain-containing protein [Planctomycetes bacterium]|nr:NPCBM/NEW2 domain-containing protein [Planctomycetota bacterium]
MRTPAVVAGLFALVVPITAGLAQDRDAGRFPLSSLELATLRQGWGTPMVDRSVTGQPLSIGGRRFASGIGSHAPGEWWIELGGRAERFVAWVGVDDDAGGRGSITVALWADGRRLFASDVLRGGMAPQQIDVDLRGVQRLLLELGTAGDGRDHDHADWADAALLMASGQPTPVPPPLEAPYLLTPPSPPEPRLNNPAVWGARPGRPFVYRIPCTGRRPLVFAVQGMPPGLTLEPVTGILRGRVPELPGRYPMRLAAENAQGRAETDFTLIVGDRLALTPPMGWNSWYIHYDRVTEAYIRRAADRLLQSGMADHGFCYVNIDDCWARRRGDEPYRDASGAILPNAKFPDMRGMVEHVHGLGLRAGIYTSPGPWTCAGYAGSWQHEEIDARTFAAWGFDFLKYDWCSYGQVATGDGQQRLTAPYAKMGAILASLDRDIVFNLCQYGMGSVWEWGASVGGHCWRTTGDLGLEAGGSLPGFYAIGLANAAHAAHAAPGAWNDPDYLLLGYVGDAHSMGEGRPTSLSPSEQYAYMSLWCLMAAPLIFSGDLERLDDFTLNVLCNREVIAIDQDPLGRQARIVRSEDDSLVLAKPLADGSLAVGLFNLAPVPRRLAVTFDELGSPPLRRVRDPWRQVDQDADGDSIAALVPRHGVHLVRCWPQE